MSTPVPGWYPDPAPAAPPSSLRWWDGQGWTEHVRPDGHGPAFVVPRPGPTTPDGQRLAGWWWRVLALVVDMVVLGVVNYLATLPVQLEVAREQQAYQRELMERIERGEPVPFTDFWAPTGEIYSDHVLAVVVFPILLLVAYQSGMLRWRGATLGKLLCGLRVRPRSEDSRLTWGTIATRIAVQFGPGWAVLPLAILTDSFATLVLAYAVAGLFFVVDALTALGERRQTIHDRAARTVVVTTR